MSTPDLCSFPEPVLIMLKTSSIKLRQCLSEVSKENSDEGKTAKTSDVFYTHFVLVNNCPLSRIWLADEDLRFEEVKTTISVDDEKEQRLLKRGK